MEEKTNVKLKKEEFALREAVKKMIGKGKVSNVKIEYTPVGEKIIISTNKPGLVIGRGGEKLSEITDFLKKNFKLDNLHIEIEEIKEPEFDAQVVADDIALGLERFGPLKFKVISYRMLEKIMKAGALGCEIRLSGKLPGARAKSWRFAQGYLKKTGDSAKVVDRAQARAETKPGTVGIKVSILSPRAILKDRINVNEKLIEELKKNQNENIETIKISDKKQKVSNKKKTAKKKTAKNTRGKK